MKRFLGLLLAVLMLVSLFGCGTDKADTTTANEDQQTENTENTADADKETDTDAGDTPEYETLRVQSMSNYNGVLLSYILDQGWADEIGLPLEVELYASGAPANEALAAGLWDVGFQGSAFVFGSVNNDAKIIGSFSDVGGDMLFVREDSPILDVQGFNPTFPELYGDPETVAGSTILFTAGTSSHQLVLEYLEKIGVGADEVSLVPMDYQTCEQTFQIGEGDIVALPTPWSLTATSEHGWKPISELRDFTTSLGDMICSKDAYENKRDELVAFMQLCYRAADELEADFDLKVAQVMKFYKECGLETTEENARAEAELRVFVTSEMQKTMPYGQSEADVADFFAAIGQIEPEQAEMFKANVVDDIWKEALQ